MTAVAVVGLGGMGGRIAGRMTGAGYQVVAWNRSPGPMGALARLGALAAATPAEAAGRADVLITMLADPAALRAVAEGPDGIAAGAGPRLTVIEMSTVGPTAVAQLASVLPDGTGLLDAPVLGSLAEAESGSLVIFAGGPALLVKAMAPLLSVLGSLVHVGDLGAGAAAKLVANAALFGTLGVLGETLALAHGLGLSREAAYRVLAATPLAAQADRRRPAIEAGEYPPRFRLALARKDAGLISEEAGAAGTDLRVTAAAGAWLAEAEQAGFGDRDYTAVLETILRSGDAYRSRARLAARRGSGREPGGYDGLIIDLDGVVWRDGDPIEGAAEAIAVLRGRGIRVLFLTNDPRSSRRALAARLTRIGIPATAADVMTSAAAVAHVVGALEGLASRRVYVIGAPALRDEIKRAGFDIVAAGTARQAEVVVVGGHDRFDYRELRAATVAIRGGARLFATGRDAVFPMPDGPWPATGAILAAVETAGGVPAVVAGKPEPVMFEIAGEALTGCEHVAMIGDHLTADIVGAKRAGLDAILVLSGTTSRADLQRAVIPPDLVLDSLAALPAAIRKEW